jgi:hypothetical protein
MSTPDASFERWRDYVLGSVPALATESVQRALDQLQSPALGNAVAGDRQHTGVLLPLLRPGPQGLAAALSAALRQQLREEFARAPSADAGSGRAAAVPIDQLTLVDDQQIEEDIEVARVIQLVDTAAEAELRDLRALCAALRASEATPEAVPLRPEVAARSLSRALNALGVSRQTRLLALRVVGKAMADRLAALLREQTRELRRWGVEPVAYQLRVVPELQRTAPSDDHAMRRLQGKLVGTAASADQLVPKLLAQVAEQSALDAHVRVLLQRLAAPAVRCAKSEPDLLTSLKHPLWRLVDRIAALGASRAGAQAARLAAHLEPVLVKLEHGADASTAAYQRALADVDALATGWADSQLADAGVSAPVAAPAEGGSLPTDWGGEGSLPTVPMELPGSADDPHKEWVDTMREGDWIRLFLHARWLTARVAGRSSAHAMLATRSGEPLQTIGRAALYRLHESGLATTIECAAPVREAVQTLTLSLE